MTPDKFPWHDPEKAEAKAREAFAWWEWMRWIYNLVVGISGITAMVLSDDMVGDGMFYAFIIVGILFYGLLANIFYSLGFLLEMIDQHYFNSNIKLYRIRLHVFILGTFLSIIVTFFGALTFFSPYWLDPAY